ncbi:hypothetical protein BAY61_13015 [Prauserella marina]|uniref:YdhG-like domain-containing protein n=1 Tax=Prauserella marina TaxID=530584 RepID=A0A222VPD8_9PSEU|nr:DUF1801 domain-containing protein [Prauserella marina]ASR35770.1 hypothetical protein BAY61_13015 [Prauserella marina]PWV84335.1 hypothetical protein DES30_101352 [Prauserella marina]SDC25057.1 hypothetical protein SAMN05421630_101985 [Prauserella marina]
MNATNTEVTNYIDKTLPWQAEVCGKLRELVHATITGAEERLQYGKPHFLKNGEHAAVIRVARGKVSFMVFGAGGIEPVKGVLRSLGNGDRKAADITEGQDVDYDLLADVLAKASGTL